MGRGWAWGSIYKTSGLAAINNGRARKAKSHQCAQLMGECYENACWMGEMAQQSRASEALPGDAGTRWQLTTVCNSSSRGSGALLLPHPPDMCTDMHAKHSVQIKNETNKQTNPLAQGREGRPWGVGSAVRSICCSCRKPEFGS